MNKEKISSLLEHSTHNINETVKYLTSLQKKEIIPISSGIDHLDKIALGGLFIDSIYSIVAKSGHGKSYSMNKIRGNILNDKEADIGILLYNLEMPFFTLLLVELKKLLKKPLKWIINNPPTEEELPMYKKATEGFRDKRLTKIDETLTPDEFYEVTKEYIERNKHKRQLFIMIDHVGIIKGKNKSESVAETMEYCNKLKLEYPRLLTFIVLGQLNREIEARWKQKEANPSGLIPTTSDVSFSSSILFFSDLVLAQVIPQVVGMGDKYASIYKKRNEHLQEHYIDDNNPTSDTARLNGNNRVYYHYLKLRLPDGEATTYCEILDPEAEEVIQAQAKYEKDYEESSNINVDF